MSTDHSSDVYTWLGFMNPSFSAFFSVCADIFFIVHQEINLFVLPVFLVFEIEIVENPLIMMSKCPWLSFRLII